MSPSDQFVHSTYSQRNVVLVAAFETVNILLEVKQMLARSSCDSRSVVHLQLLNDTASNISWSTGQFGELLYQQTFHLSTRDVHINKVGMRVSDIQLFRFNDTSGSFMVSVGT